MESVFRSFPCTFEYSLFGRFGWLGSANVGTRNVRVLAVALVCWQGPLLSVLTTFAVSGPGPYSILAGDSDHVTTFLVFWYARKEPAGQAEGVIGGFCKSWFQRHVKQDGAAEVPQQGIRIWELQRWLRLVSQSGLQSICQRTLVSGDVNRCSM